MAAFIIDTQVGFVLTLVRQSFAQPFLAAKWPTVAGTIVRCQFEKCGQCGDYVVLENKYKADWMVP